MSFICRVFLLLFEAERGLTGGEEKESINDCLEPLVLLLFEELILLLLLEFDLLKKFIFVVSLLLAGLAGFKLLLTKAPQTSST